MLAQNLMRQQQQNLSNGYQQMNMGNYGQQNNNNNGQYRKWIVWYRSKVINFSLKVISKTNYYCFSAIK